MEQTAKVTDKSGRVIEIRNLKPLDRMRLMELVGPENSKNEQYLGYAALAYSVVSIDGVPEGRPSKRLALETIVQELDEEGLDAVGEGIKKNFMSETATVDAVKNA